VEVKFPFFMNRTLESLLHNGYYEGYYDIWLQAIEYLSETPFCFDNTNTCIKFDWKDSYKIVSERNEFTFGVYNKKFESIDEILETFKVLRDKYVSISCQVSGEGIKADDAKKSVLSFLTLFYLSLNLAETGSAHIDHMSISVNDENSVDFNSVLQLPSEPFEFIEDFPSKYGWPSIKRLRFIDVWNWLNKLDIPNTPTAVNNTQRALFALVYSCKQEFGSPPELIWLAHALEALFDTPPMGISKALRERIFLVLGIPEKHSREITKKVNEFYDLRSVFVHGDTEIISPIVNSHNTSDEIFEKHELPVGNAGSIARAILVGTFQKMIENDWKKMEFSTIYKGL
ncbi:MAG: hypothetical protein RL536_108, partial [Candidatus Parcubacteria bacterium]